MADPLAEVIRRSLHRTCGSLFRPEVVDDLAASARAHIAAALDAEEARWRKPASWPAHKAIDNLRSALLGTGEAHDGVG